MDQTVLILPIVLADPSTMEPVRRAGIIRPLVFVYDYNLLFMFIDGLLVVYSYYTRPRLTFIQRVD